MSAISPRGRVFEEILSARAKALELASKIATELDNPDTKTSIDAALA
ncbi:MAG: hypothetical protein Q6373_012835 [Candidatus Sigynarchaeota archaeon]